MGSKNQTHCVNGHEFSAENTRYSARGHRNCRACKTAHSRKTRNSALPEGIVLRDGRAKTNYAREFFLRDRLGKVAESAAELWDVYINQAGMRPKRMACKYGHPKTRENSTCRWITYKGKTYVRADCRICAARTSREAARRKRGEALSVFDVFGQLPRADEDPKETERRRIEDAIIEARRREAASQYRPHLYWERKKQELAAKREG